MVKRGCLTTIIIIVLLFVVMVSLNPSMTTYQTWVKDQLQSRTDNPIIKATIGLLSGGVQYVTTRQSYTIYSIYTTDVGNYHFKVIGIFGTFLPIEYNN